VALCLDLTLRREGHGSLDAVMRRLWALGANNPDCIGITEADIARALHEVGGRSFEPELRAWVHGKGELPVEALLPTMGMVQMQEPERLSAAWGLRLNEGPVTGCVVRQVLRGSAAEAAGLCAGDELLAVQGWRVRRLDDAVQWLAQAAPVELLINRDQRILQLRLQPQASTTRLPTLQWALDEAHAKADPACALRRQQWWSAST
jgi:predicted metalloprotease with PDZ domain